MDQQEVIKRYHRCNEMICETIETLRDTENRLRRDDPERQEWYLEKKAQLEADLEELWKQRAMFLREYGDII